MFVWRWIAVAGLAALIIGWAMGFFVYAARPQRAQNRRLALMSVLFGSGVGLLAGLRPLTDDFPTAFGFYVAYLPVFYAAFPVYVYFLATLDSPLTRPLRTPGVKPAIAAYFLGMCALAIVSPDLFIASSSRNVAFGHWAMHETPLYRWGLQGVSALILVYGLFVAVDYWRRASNPLQRRQAGAYALAFVVRDALYIGVSVAGAMGLDFSTAIGGIAALVILPVAEIALAVLLAYGILSTQLFEIDLKIKWSIRRGSVAAAFVGVFFVASEGAQQVLSDAMGPVVGLLAAGGLVFALAPLQRAADRLADAAMPSVRDTPDYRETRRRDIYRNAVMSALQDGIVTESERTVLAGLASDLDLTPREALEIEREASHRM